MQFVAPCPSETGFCGFSRLIASLIYSSVILHKLQPPYRYYSVVQSLLRPTTFIRLRYLLYFKILNQSILPGEDPDSYNVAGGILIKLPRIVLALFCLSFCTGLGLPPVSTAGAISPQSPLPDPWIRLNNPTIPGGTVLDLAIAPSDTDLLYAWLDGETGPRLLRSQDAALSWQQVYTSTLPVTSLAVAPDDSHVLYAGGASGLYRSPDGGLSWTQVYTLAQVMTVVSSTLVYTGGLLEPPPASGCYTGLVEVAYSSDGGLIWQSATLGCATTLTSIIIDPADPFTIYVGGGAEDRPRPAVWRSTTGGSHWQSIWPAETGFGEITSLAIDPSAPQRVYAAVYDSGVYFSPDSGGTWQHSDQLPNHPFTLAAGGGNLYAAVLYQQPKPYIYRSNDGGLTWWQSLERFPDWMFVLRTVPGDPQRLYAVLESYGVWRSDSYAGHWQEANTGMRSPVAYPVLALDPTQPDRLYAGTAWGRPGLFESDDAGLSWTTVLTDTSIRTVIVHPVEPVSVFAGGDGALFQIRNGIATQVFLRSFIWNLSLSAHNPPNLLVSGFAADNGRYCVYRYRPTTDGSAWIWTVSFFPAGQAVMTVVGDPFTPDTLYAGGDIGGSGAVWRSQDGGNVWQPIFQTPANWVRYLLADAFRPGWLYAVLNDGPYFSQDGGFTWTRRADGFTFGGKNLSRLVQDEWGRLYAVDFDEGIFRWSPLLETWESLGEPESSVGSLLYRSTPSPALLVGGEYNLWQLDLSPLQRTWFPTISR
jgi:photosystem II stability/assembly factor-like uncharacterized protein